MLLLVVHLQARAQLVLTLGLTHLVFPPGIVEVPAADGRLRTIGVLPTLTQREAQTLGELVATRHRGVETMANAPIRRTPVVVTAIGLVADILAEVVVEQHIACRQLHILQGLVLSTDAQTPAVQRLQVVTGTQLSIQTHTDLLGEFLLGTHLHHQSCLALC